MKKKKTSYQTTIGLDLGDRKHHVCVLGLDGEILQQTTICNSRLKLKSFFSNYPQSQVILEVGCHSPWISRYLKELGLKVIVANARKLRAIYQNERKSDSADAQMLARIGRADPKLLHPLEHRSESSQQHFLWIKSRDRLVRTRVEIINSIRFSLKSLGYAVSNPSAPTFLKRVQSEVPSKCLQAMEPLLRVVDQLNAEIKAIDRAIKTFTQEHYPEAVHLQQIPGVGPITALSFVLKVETTQRFKRLRDIGPFLGLTPRRDQSGNIDKQLSITKCGDGYLRRLLVSCSQYILGAFGPPSELRDFGLRLTERGSRTAKKKAVVAVARKLAVLMLSLWKNNSTYQPYPTIA